MKKTFFPAAVALLHHVKILAHHHPKMDLEEGENEVGNSAKSAWKWTKIDSGTELNAPKGPNQSKTNKTWTNSTEKNAKKPLKGAKN